MENLDLPEIDFTTNASMNIRTYNHWLLKNDNLENIISIENFFTCEEVDNIIKLGLAYKKEISLTADGNVSEIRKSKNSWIPPSELSFWIFAKIQSAVEKANEYFEFDLTFIENLQFTEYDSKYKGNYGKHVDKYISPPIPTSHRKLSFSVQLTDPSLYEGGDLLIYAGDEDGAFAKKTKGTINFFPSYVLHEVTPVTKGKRYSLVSWVNGPRFK